MWGILDISVYNSSLHYIVVLRGAKPVLRLDSVTFEYRSTRPVRISGDDTVIEGMPSA